MFLCLQDRPSFHDILEFWPNRGKEQGDTGVIKTIKGVLGNTDNQGRHWVIKGDTGNKDNPRGHWGINNPH